MKQALSSRTNYKMLPDTASCRSEQLIIDDEARTDCSSTGRNLKAEAWEAEIKGQKEKLHEIEKWYALDRDSKLRTKESAIYFSISCARLKMHPTLTP